MLNLFQYIGLRYLRLKPGRVLLTMLGVAIGIALYVAIAIINHSTQDSLRNSIEAVSGKSKISISAGASGFDEAKLEIVRTTAGVKYAVPMIEARAYFEGATDSNQGLYILGVDMLQEQAVRTYKASDDGAGQRVIDDPLTFLNQADSIVLTKAFAIKKGLTVDSKIKLATSGGLKTFTVRGLLEPEGAARAYGGSLAIMDIDGARMMFGKENKLDRIDIIPTSEVTVEQVKNNLSQALGPSFTVETPEAQSQQMQDMLGSYQMLLTFFSSLALLVGLFLVMNSISVSVAERRKEIGTLRALGATRSSMVTLFVTEILGIGLIGSALGCVLGRLLAEKLVVQVSQSVAAQFQMRIEVTHLEFTSGQIFFSIFLGTFASLIAAFLPAAKAATIHPLETMKRHTQNASQEEERRANLVVILGAAFVLFNAVSLIFHWGKFWIGIDLLTRASSVFGVALLGPFVVYLLIYAVRNLTRTVPFPIFRLAQENLIRSKKRTTSNVMALMVGLFLVMLIACVRSSFHDTLMNWLDRVFIADIMVSSSGKFINADVQPIREEIQNELLQIPGIRPVGEGHGVAIKVVPIIYHKTKMVIKAHDHYADFYQYRSFGVEHGDRITIAKTIYEKDQNHLLASQSFLTKENKKVGDTILLPSPSGEVPFLITGEITDFASPNGVFYMSRENYKKYWKDTLVTGFLVSIEPGHTLEQVRANIDEKIGQKWNLVTVSNAEFRNQMQLAIDRSFAYTKAIEMIALLVGLLGLLNTLLISVMERTREIGMLRAVGSTQSQISRMIMTESIIQGFFGAIIAVVFGSWVGYLFVNHALSASLGWMVDFYFPREAIVNTIGTGVLVAIVAGVLPAYRAAHLNITEALDYE